MIHRTETELHLDQVVFESRNQNYGAYELRMIYNDHLRNALTITLVTVGTLTIILLAGITLLPKTAALKTDTIYTITTLDLEPYKKQEVPPAIQHKHEPATPSKATPSGPITYTPSDQVSPEVPTTETLPSEGPLAGEPSNEPNVNNSGGEAMAPSAPAPEPIIPTLTFAEKRPEFKGGESARLKFMQQHIRYPNDAAEAAYEGKVYVQFVIDHTGAVGQVHVARSSGFASLDSEAVRVTRLMPNWIPAEHENRPVNFQITSPIFFKLQ